MPPAKPMKRIPLPPAGVKKPVQGATPLPGHVPAADQQTEARETRTREFLREASAREAELTKKGYCF